MKRFPWLKINGSVFHLDHHIFFKLTIERSELLRGFFETITIGVRAVHECSPYYQTPVWLKSLGQHIGAVSMGSAVFLRTGLTFGICLYQKATEVWNVSIYLIHFLSPPLNHLRVKRIGIPELTQYFRRCEIDGQENPDAIGPENVGNCFDLGKILRGQETSACIHVVQDNGIDTNGSISTGIIGVTGVNGFRKFIPFP